MSETLCVSCGCNLSGGIDTFGDIANPLCFKCWREVEYTLETSLSLIEILNEDFCHPESEEVPREQYE